MAKQQQALIVQQRIRARKAEQKLNPELSSVKQDAKLDPHLVQVETPRELTAQERASTYFLSLFATPVFFMEVFHANILWQALYLVPDWPDPNAAKNKHHHTATSSESKSHHDQLSRITAVCLAA